MSARPRGFITDWRPRPETLAVLSQVEAVLVEYAEQLPLTLRQIFTGWSAFMHTKNPNKPTND